MKAISGKEREIDGVRREEQKEQKEQIGRTKRIMG